MNNYFITDEPYKVAKKASPFVKIINKGLQVLGLKYNVQQNLDMEVDMNTVEQRMNYYHLLDNTIKNKIPGEIVELGCFTGQCAMLFQKIIELNTSGKKLHLYDSFYKSFKVKGNIEDVLKQNFLNANLQLPVIHKGSFEDTLPAELPDQIAFCHIDCGFGGDRYEHKKIMLHCFKSIYDKMPKDAVCVLMDYHDENELAGQHNVNPGVKLAFDEFFRDKPEEIIGLYGNQYQHAYFRKV